MPKCRVAVDIRDLRIAKTGVRTYLEELIREFKMQESDTLSFVFLDSTFAPYTGSNKFFKLIEHIRFFVWKQISLPFLALIKGCDVIFCVDFFVPFFSLKAKTIPVLHDAFFFEYPNHYNKIWLWIFRNIGIPAAKKASFIVTPTHYAAKRIQHFTQIDLKKIKVIYEGPKTMSPSLKPESEVLGKIYGRKYILHVGVMEKRKNLLNLIKAFEIVEAESPGTCLVLAGQFSSKANMDDRQQILGYIHSKHLEEKVHLPGYIPDNEMAIWYRNATVYAFPSYNEGFGIPILEAFEQKVPVVVANNSCLPEVGGDAVLTFDPSNVSEIAHSIQTVLRNPELRQDLIKRGEIRGSNFKWSKTAKELIELFKKA